MRTSLRKWFFKTLWTLIVKLKLFSVRLAPENFVVSWSTLIMNITNKVQIVLQSYIPSWWALIQHFNWLEALKINAGKWKVSSFTAPPGWKLPIKLDHPTWIIYIFNFVSCNSWFCRKNFYFENDFSSEGILFAFSVQYQ